MKDDSKRLFATIQAITRRIHVCFFVCLLDMKTIINHSWIVKYTRVRPKMDPCGLHTLTLNVYGIFTYIYPLQLPSFASVHKPPPSGPVIRKVWGIPNETLHVGTVNLLVPCSSHVSPYNGLYNYRNIWIIPNPDPPVVVVNKKQQDAAEECRKALESYLQGWQLVPRR